MKEKWDSQKDEHGKQKYLKMRQKGKKEVAKAKNKAYWELYERLDTEEGENDLYWLARQRDQAWKDVQQVWVIKKKGSIVRSADSESGSAAE